MFQCDVIWHQTTVWEFVLTITAEISRSLKKIYIFIDEDWLLLTTLHLTQSLVPSQNSCKACVQWYSFNPTPCKLDCMHRKCTVIYMTYRIWSKICVCFQSCVAWSTEELWCLILHHYIFYSSADRAHAAPSSNPLPGNKFLPYFT